MFTGIIEAIGTVQKIQPQGSNLIFDIESPISQELQIDQSVSHNGACLTVVGIRDQVHQVIAIAETLQKTNLGFLQAGHQVNLERSMTLQRRLDGHMVQGHVDTVGACSDRMEKDGSVEFAIEFSPEFAHLVIEKGSIALNGISLTVFNTTHQRFSIAIIPYTLEHTTMQNLLIGDKVNLEFDLVGKYVARDIDLSREGLKKVSHLTGALHDQVKG